MGQVGGMGALIRPVKLIAPAGNLSCSIRLCHDPCFPYGGRDIEFWLFPFGSWWWNLWSCFSSATSVCYMKQELGVDQVIENCSPTDWGGSYPFPLYYQPVAWGRGICLLLFGFLLGPSSPLCCRWPCCTTLYNMKSGRRGNRRTTQCSSCP